MALLSRGVRFGIVRSIGMGWMGFELTRACACLVSHASAKAPAMRERANANPCGCRLRAYSAPGRKAIDRLVGKRATLQCMTHRQMGHPTARPRCQTKFRLR